MCKTTNEGYLLSNGRLVPFHNANFSELTPEEFRELSDSKSTKLESIVVRQALHDLRQDLQNMLNLLTVESRAVSCPVNEKRIKEIVCEQIKTQPKKALKVISDYSLKVTAVLNLLVLIYLIFNGAIK